MYWCTCYVTNWCLSCDESVCGCEIFGTDDVDLAVRVYGSIGCRKSTKITYIYIRNSDDEKEIFGYLNAIMHIGMIRYNTLLLLHLFKITCASCEAREVSVNSDVLLHCFSYVTIAILERETC